MNYEIEVNGGHIKSDSKEAGSPTRVMHMRQSKINHSILQKRYREDEVVNESENKNAGNLEENLISSEQHSVVERNGNKRRFVDNQQH